MQKFPKIEVFLTVLVTLFFLGVGFGHSPAFADCCSKEKEQVTTKVVVENSCCLPSACCCKPANGPVKETQSLAGFYNLRREISTSTAGLASSNILSCIDVQDKNLKGILALEAGPVRSKLFILYRSLLI
ncbi:MAG: hypothetical protein SFY67_14800 [Candidatus Melainabacteria bacterium]|nr:hypothetical protein [Candidatus Melainabacteria bacterium]